MNKMALNISSSIRLLLFFLLLGIHSVANTAASDNLTECANQIEKDNGPLALQFCQRAYLENPNLPDVYFWRGGAFTLLNRFNEAVQDYSRFLALEPDEPLAYKNRAVAYRGKGDLRSALSDATHALELNPKLYEAWVVRAMTYYVLGLYSQAFEDIEKAIALSPDREPAYTARGHMNNWVRYDHAQASEDFETGMRLNPKSYQVRAFQAEHAFFFLKNPELAYQELNNAMILRPNGEWTLIITSAILREQGQHLAALNAVNQAIALSPSSWLGYIHRALLFSQRSDLHSALRDINAALYLAPDSVMALYVRSRIFAELRRLNEAAVDCMRVIDISGGQYWPIYENIGYIFTLNKDPVRAAAAYRDYIRRAPAGDPHLPEVQEKLHKLGI